VVLNSESRSFESIFRNFFRQSGVVTLTNKTNVQAAGNVQGRVHQVTIEKLP
jgi:hypothetical protein